MMGTFYTAPENTFQKHAFWLVSGLLQIFHVNVLMCAKAFNACQAATLSPMFFFAPAILGRAALYTVGLVGSLSYIGATAT